MSHPNPTCLLCKQNTGNLRNLDVVSSQLGKYICHVVSCRQAPDRLMDAVWFMKTFHGAAIIEVGCGGACAHRGLGAVLSSLVNRNNHVTHKKSQELP